MTIKEVEIIVEMYKKEVNDFQKLLCAVYKRSAGLIDIEKSVNDFRKKIVEKLSKKID